MSETLMFCMSGSCGDMRKKEQAMHAVGMALHLHNGDEDDL